VSRLADHRALALTAAATAVALAALLALGLAGWPGQPNGCFETMRPNCFCEGPWPGPVAQPANTFSNLGFVAVGLALAALADRDRRSVHRRRSFDSSQQGRSFHSTPADAASSPLPDAPAIQTLFAVVTALLGPGSMALHASLTRWGGHVDVASMYLYASLLVAYGVARAYGLSVRGFAALYVPLACLLVASKVAGPWSSDVIFAGVLAAAGASDALAVRRRREWVRDRRLLLAALALFATAFAIWLPSRTGGPLCIPGSWVQGHAAWHLLCAASAGLLFAYLRSERPRAA
jgi:hypothetical protein